MCLAHEYLGKLHRVYPHARDSSVDEVPLASFQLAGLARGRSHGHDTNSTPFDEIPSCRRAVVLVGTCGSLTVAERLFDRDRPDP